MVLTSFAFQIYQNLFLSLLIFSCLVMYFLSNYFYFYYEQVNVVLFLFHLIKILHCLILMDFVVVVLFYNDPFFNFLLFIIFSPYISHFCYDFYKVLFFELLKLIHFYHSIQLL